ncbi:uncharacterized protein A4U43_C10F950 [Asparagus officinalis]|uniref:F-box associated beta-propeller type 3 domain-containing protein n=1 Tax=Asparagus officinalis TaxID=4686 RepID=A0A5P1DZQ1_ASPOF|nr:uncharacterized protein A4U43_C10F950 [Asparagus officinalis]
MCHFGHVDNVDDNIDSIEISTSNARLTGFKDKGMSLRIEAYCDGLVCFSSYGSYCICNPLTMEWITVPRSSYNTALCGFYFHPSTGECRLLNCSDNVVVFTLGKHSRREIKSSFEDNTAICSPSGNLMCVVHPVYCANPVLFSGSLHWTPHSYRGILTFNTDSEKFRKMSVPPTGAWYNEARVFRQAHVLEMDELGLSFWQYAGGWEIGTKGTT